MAQVSGAAARRGLATGALRWAVLLSVGVFMLLPLVAMLEFSTRGIGGARSLEPWLAIGANRRQLVSQLMLEACVLAAMGGAAGLLVARWTVALITSLLPADTAGSLNFGLDLRAVAFTAALALATGLLFGLFLGVGPAGVESLAADLDAHLEAFGVIGTLLVEQLIGGRRPCLALRELLQQRLVVAA